MHSRHVQIRRAAVVSLMLVLAPNALALGLPKETAQGVRGSYGFQENGVGPFFSAGSPLGDVRLNGATLALEPGAGCYPVGAQIPVAITLSSDVDVAGGQYFLAYDPAKLAITDIVPQAPWSVEIYRNVSTPGEIDYANGIPGGGTGAQSGPMATVTFTALTEVCEAERLVTFRAHTPPTTLTRAGGSAVPLVTRDLPALTIDSTPPTIGGCPPGPVSLGCNPAPPTCASAQALLTITDNCSTPAVTCVPGDEQLNGCVHTQTFTVTATDACNNSAHCAVVFSWTVDTTPPTITGCPPVPIDLGCNPPAPTCAAALALLTIDDACGAPSVTCEPGTEQIQGCVHTRAFTVTATDACSNSAECVVTYTWTEDLTPPVITGCPSAPISLGCNPAALPTCTDVLLLLSISDGCSSPTIDCVPGVEQVQGCSHTLMFTVTATDACHNSAECAVTYMWTSDTVAPVITGCPPAPVELGCNPTPPTCAAAVALLTISDGCGTPTVGCEAGIEQIDGCRHSQAFTVTATDGCQNSTQCVVSFAWAVDTTAPVITCPPDIQVNADAGFCHAVVDPGFATATDNCDPHPAVVGVRSDALPLNVPYPAGQATTITWTATDACGNASHCIQTVTVSRFNAVDVAVALCGVVAPGPFVRCVRFEFWNCPAPTPVVVETELAFQGGVATGVALVDCGAYSCITAADPQHTLRRTTTLVTNGSRYAANFAGGDCLVGGNLNDDTSIDILDFGVLMSRWLTHGDPNSACGTLAPHADINGDGLVSGFDFQFVQTNFLQRSEPECCAGPEDSAGGPVVRISVAELRARGLGALASGDLNGDGWLDQEDIAAFVAGARPRLPALNAGSGRLQVP